MNRCFLLLIALYLAGSTLLFAQQSRFDQANELLDQNRVEEALELYRAIEREGAVSGKLYYNMGFAAVYLDSLGLAKFYFMKSSRYQEVREDALEAVRFVNSQFSRRSAVLPKLPWERFFDWLSDSFGASGLFFTGMILFNLGVAGVIWSWFSGRFTVWIHRAGLGASLFALLLIGATFYLEWFDLRYDTGVMVAEQSVVYEYPRTESVSVSTAYEGYTMTVDHYRSEQSDEWYYVRLQNGMYGWIPREHLRVI